MTIKTLLQYEYTSGDIRKEVAISKKNIRKANARGSVKFLDWSIHPNDRGASIRIHYEVGGDPRVWNIAIPRTPSRSDGR